MMIRQQQLDFLKKHFWRVKERLATQDLLIHESSTPSLPGRVVLEIIQVEE